MKNGMRAIHPGEILREEYLLPLGVSAHALSQALRVPPARINEIVREKRGVTPDTALRLARFFGGDAKSWMNLQIAYDLKIAEKTAAKLIAREVPTLAELAASDARFVLAA
ncbi:MAG: HigA family addiction module antidote protein [Ramlibacter sp.]|nr:HigA family addiction module antidote protein [Ramlibacter sp.]